MATTFEQEKKETQQTLQIQRFYVKEKSFKSPYAPDVFKEDWKPEINIEMNVKNNALQETNTYEVVIQLTIIARNQNRTAISIEVQQAGSFKIENVQGEALQRLLAAYCPNLLFPYASKAVADAMLEASLPAVTLTPMNFEALYQQQQQQSAEKEAEKEVEKRVTEA